jgi:MFS family permease
MRDRNENIKPNQRAFDIKLLRRYPFVLLLLWGFYRMMGYTILLFSLPDYAARIGLGLQQVAVVGAMVNLGMAVGRPIVGYYSDSVGGINMAAEASFFGSLVCFFVWMFAKSYGVLVLAALLGKSLSLSITGSESFRKFIMFHGSWIIDTWIPKQLDSSKTQC